MAIGRNYGNGHTAVDALQRKLDQAYELAGLARQDGDVKDAQRWTTEAEKIKQQIREMS